MILQVEDMHTYYGLVHMLHGVSLHVVAGEFVGLLGRNGAANPPPSRASWVWCLHAAAVSGSKGKRLPQPPYMIARHGIAYVPGTRGIFSQLTTLENLNMVRNRQSR